MAQRRLGSPEQEFSFLALLCYLETDYWLSSSHNKPQGQFHLGKKADKKLKYEAGFTTRAHIFLRVSKIRTEKGKEIISSMFKVRTLPVRFGTKKLGEDRSSQPFALRAF